MIRITISNSTLTDGAKCLAKGVIRLNGYTAKGDQPDMKMEAGRCIHLGLAKWMEGATREQALAAFENAYRPYSDRYVSAKQAYHIDRLKRVLYIYLTMNRLEVCPFTVEQVEQWMTVPLGEVSERETYEGIEVSYLLRSDGLVRDSSGNLWVMEHKTHNGRIDEAYENGFSVDSQLMGQIYAHRAKGYAVAGVMLNAINIWVIDADDRRCGVHKEPKRDCWPKHVEYRTFSVTAGEEMLEAWRAETLAQAVALARAYDLPHEELGYQGLYTRECRYCEFSGYCQRGRDISELSTRRDDPDVQHSMVEVV